VPSFVDIEPDTRRNGRSRRQPYALDPLDVDVPNEPVGETEVDGQFLA
jgi:hypothetical protein